MRPCWLVVTSCPQTSNTFPSMCRASLETAICNLETIALVQTADLHGNLQVGRETALVQCGCTVVLETKVIRMFPKISLGPSPG